MGISVSHILMVIATSCHLKSVISPEEQIVFEVGEYGNLDLEATRDKMDELTLSTKRVT